MSTVAPPQLERLGREISSGRIKARFPSAQLSGLIGDARHASNGGYHIGRAFQSSSNYSVGQFAQDRKGDASWAAGFDMNLSDHDMLIVTANLKRVFDDRSHPARKYLRAFNGTDGSGDADRFDIGKQVRSSASNDHKWHIHGEIYREYANDPSMVDTVVAAILGTSAPTATGDDLMAVADTITYEIRPWSMETRTIIGRLETKVDALTVVLSTLADALKAGGSDLDTAAVLSKLDGLANQLAEANRQNDELKNRLAEALKG